MQVIIQRGQGKTRVLQKPLFKLWVKFELTPEEAALISEYHVGNMVLSEGVLEGQFIFFLKVFAGGEFKLAAYLAVLPAVLIFSLGATILIAFLLWAIAAYLIYNEVLQIVKVSDFLTGREFACRSVVDLTNMERDLGRIAQCFLHLLEAMKNWGGREIIEVTLSQPPLLQVIEKSHESA